MQTAQHEPAEQYSGATDLDAFSSLPTLTAHGFFST